jgi:Crp-like helix-turn-helix domain
VNGAGIRSAEAAGSEDGPEQFRCSHVGCRISLSGRAEPRWPPVRAVRVAASRPSSVHPSADPTAASKTFPRSSVGFRRWIAERPLSSRGALGGLAELGGELGAQIARRSDSIALARGAAWGLVPSSDVALLTVEEGFVAISAAMGEGGSDGGRHGNCGRRIILATGESGALLAPPAPGERLVALTPCRVAIISSESLRALLRLPIVAEAIADGLADALSERQATIRNCVYVRHCERVREKLLQLARGYGHVVPGGVRIDFPLTHQLLADMIGSARETVSLALAELARDGFVHRQQRRYVVRISPHDLVPPDAMSASTESDASAPR